MSPDQVHTTGDTEYVVIGATENSDDLPLRLRPVVRTRELPHAYALLYEDDDGTERVVPEHEEFIREHMEQGTFYELPCPIARRPGHWLIRLAADRPPEYVPPERARQRLREEGMRALDRCERAVAIGDMEQARDHAGYANLAMPEDPIPTLLRIALWRDALSASQLRWELSALDGMEPAAILQRFREFRRDHSSWRHVMARIERDPLADEYKLRSPGVSDSRRREYRRRALEQAFTRLHRHQDAA